MSIIVPTVLAETEEDFKNTIEQHHSYANRVHIDITDGEFAPTFTVGINQIWWPQEWSVDIHAMVARPSQYVDALIQLKPATIIFHAEASEDLVPIIAKVKQAGIKAGVALLRTTVPSTVQNYIEIADHVLVFSGELGRYGGVASLMQLEKVRLIRTIHPEVEVGWDGGANVENAFSLVQGGVDVINVGSSINKSPDPAATYQQLVDEINKHSVI